ncbi:MAG TPA: alpha/beta fold hydrolase [Thermoanaerobaculia bacterium]|jgi:pimeloyl-ACP methyl ester carboxylesterase/ketosteroid isomerase-like protein
MKITAAVLAILLAIPALADAVEDVRQAEIGFAKAFADRDKTKFFAYVANDAVFLGGLAVQRGKDAVVKRWSRFFDNQPVAPFSWGPERIEITGNGTIGLSTGPVFDAEGNAIAQYASIWLKQGDGTWKVILDGPGQPAAPTPQNAAKLEEGMIPTADGAQLYYRKLSGGSPITIIAPLDFVLHEPLQQFADLATIITYDLRSRGKSSKADVKTLTIDQDVADLETVRAFHKVDKFIPLGFSYLGKVVAMYAAQHPEHVSRVIQLGPAANRMADFPRTMAKEFGAHVSLWPSIEKATLSAEELKKITMPVLVIHGDKDRNAPYAGGQAWVATLPDARLVTVPGAGHTAWRDDPVTVMGAIRHFIRGEFPLGSSR